MKVLVADADPTWLDLLSRIVSSSAPDVKVLKVTNGKDALDALKLGLVEAVVASHQMPGVSGDEVRRQAALQGIPAVLVSEVPPLSIAGCAAHVPKDADLVREAVEGMVVKLRGFGRIKAAARKGIAYFSAVG